MQDENYAIKQDLIDLKEKENSESGLKVQITLMMSLQTRKNSSA